jgi:pimeloyl-ACP methyl ester carboxylesterase
MGPRVFPDFITEKDRQELKTIRPVWLKFHQEWIDKISTGRHLITENSGHGIPFEEPELVVRTIREVVEQARDYRAGTSRPP